MPSPSSVANVLDYLDVATHRKGLQEKGGLKRKAGLEKQVCIYQE